MTADIRTAAEPYTPTTDEVREAIAEWSWSRRMFRDELAQSGGSEFDRWHAKHTPTREQIAETLVKRRHPRLHWPSEAQTQIGHAAFRDADAVLALMQELAEGGSSE